MKNFPGRTIEEIISLASDIMNEKGQNSATSYVINKMLPAAADAIYDNGDYYMESLGYSLSTVTTCAEKIAGMIDKTGMVDIS